MNRRIARASLLASAVGFLAVVARGSTLGASSNTASGVVIEGVTLPSEIIPGYQVITAITPAEDPCQLHPELYVQGPRSDSQSLMASGDNTQIAAALHNLGLDDVGVTIGGPRGLSADEQEALVQQSIQIDIDQFNTWGQCERLHPMTSSSRSG